MKLRFLVLFLAFVASSLANGQTNKIKVLLLEGVSNHDWKHRANIVRAILAKDGSFDVDITVTPSSAGDPAWATWRPNFSAYDVVLSGYNNLGGKPAWPAEVQAAFQSYLSSGGGFYVYHEANNSFAEWSEYNRMIGLGWRDASQGAAIIVNPDESLQIIPSGTGSDTFHGARVNVEVKQLGSHPIHQGLPASWMAADIEIYQYARGPQTNFANLTVLAYAKDPTTQVQFPIEWVVQYGQGRVFASSYGHVWSDQPQPNGTRCAAFQTLMVRALKWLAGRDPGTSVPADFPSSTTTSLRPHEEGVRGLDQSQAVGAFNSGFLPSQSIPPGSVLVQAAFTNLMWESPIVVIPWPSSTNLLILELEGRFYRVPDNDATTNRTLVLDIRDRAWYYNWDTGNQGSKHGGAQNAVFHPRFGMGEGKDFLYVFYLRNTNDDQNSAPPYYDRLARFTFNSGTATFDPASELIMIQQHDTTKGHDGGGMTFGPDGFLYIAYGDEGIQGTGATPYTQKLNEKVRSGVWRLDVDQQGGAISHAILRQPIGAPTNNTFTQGYFIPNSNPWQDPTGGTLEEYYAIGLRQPHRMSFDPVSGFFWIGDVGHGTREEVDVMDAPGLNFQWNYLEGTANGFRPPPVPLIGTEQLPIFDYDHGFGNCVIGGYVYRGAAIPWMVGRYLFGDNGSQRIYALDYDPVTRTTLSVLEIGQGRAGALFNGISSWGRDAQGEPFIMQLAGGATNGGRISRIKPNPGVVDNSRFPTNLSGTHLFTNLLTLAPAAGLIPFEVNMPLWSSGTDKKRWLMIPNDGTPNTNTEQITYSENNPWVLPIGSVLVKQFSMPNGGPRLETRVLIRGTDGGWGGVAYKWLADQSDAVLLEQGGVEPLNIDGENVNYLYPSRSQCAICHNNVAGGILGLRTRQFNRRITYPTTGRVANQIETLSGLGLMQTNLTEMDLANVVTSAARDNPNVSNEWFVRSYIDANCSQCHQPGGNQAIFDARLTTPLASQNLLCGAVADALGLTSPAVIKPGLLGQSVMFHRMNTMDEGVSMPPLAKGRVDQVAVTRMANWILGMDPDACTFVAASTIALGDGTSPSGSTSVDSWNSNMVINETDTYTNTTASPLNITLSRFQFHANRIRDPITPFIVRINGDNNFTVRAVGTSRSVYAVGANDFPFADSPAVLTLAAGEKIGIGFLDALANGTGGVTNGAVTYQSGTNRDQIHYSGGTGNANSGSVTVGLAPVFGTTVRTDFGRDYFFTITFTIGTAQNPDSDGDGLPDSWEFAYTGNLNTLSALADSDNDGIKDADERASGTNPLDANSRFQVRELRPQPGFDPVGTFDSIPGRTYRVWASSDLKTWKDMGTRTSADWPATKTQVQLTAADLPVGSDQKLFMRISVVRTTP